MYFILFLHTCTGVHSRGVQHVCKTTASEGGVLRYAIEGSLLLMWVGFALTQPSAGFDIRVCEREENLSGLIQEQRDKQFKSL